MNAGLRILVIDCDKVIIVEDDFRLGLAFLFGVVDVAAKFVASIKLSGTHTGGS